MKKDLYLVGSILLKAINPDRTIFSGKDGLFFHESARKSPIECVGQISEVSIAAFPRSSFSLPPRTSISNEEMVVLLRACNCLSPVWNSLVLGW